MTAPWHCAAEVGEHQSVLPARLRLLCVSAAEPSWTVLALLLDKHGCTEPQFRWCETGAAALAMLRDETFDCIVLHEASPVGGAARLSTALPFLQAVAAGGGAEPVLVLAGRADDEWLLACSACDCEVLVTTAGWQSHALPAWIGRTLTRTHLAREVQRLASADRRRAVLDRDESEQMIEQQRRIIGASLAVASGPTHEAAGSDTPLPEQVSAYYEELLRAYVMMGSGNLADEIRKLAQLFVLAGISPRAALRVHLERVEGLIRGLGSRSSRHVMVRADILAMELMIQVGECYRERSQTRGLGDYGIDLLHAESLRQKGEG
jgi:CheY-like chemotaxis protein